jgi:hypothetical protein
MKLMNDKIEHSSGRLAAKLGEVVKATLAGGSYQQCEVINTSL